MASLVNSLCQTLSTYGINVCSQTVWATVGVVTGVYLLYRWFQPYYDDSNVPILTKYLKGLKYIDENNKLRPHEVGENDVEEIVKEMRLVFKSNYTKPLRNRMKQLLQLKKLISENEEALVTALDKDLNRSGLIAYAYDIFPTLAEINKAIKNLYKWNAPKSVGMSLITAPSVDYLVREPYGTVYINGIWNFPIQLLLSPLVGAIAAGNNAIVSPCNAAPATSKLLCELIDKYMDGRFVTVIGGPDSKELADDRKRTGFIIENNRFDMMFFTGSTGGGKYFAKVAARTLTPLILELGGKNPVIVDKTADVRFAAKQCMFARVVNCGQQCISPDYVLCDENVYEEFCKQLLIQTKSLFKDEYKSCKSQSKLIHKDQLKRVNTLLKSTKGKVLYGGSSCSNTLRYEPTIVAVDKDDPTMEHETFGPVLWVMKSKNLEESVEYINSKEKPLSLYMFTSSQKNRDYVVYNTSSGGMQINGVCAYAGHGKIPFGGVGSSGMGRYHGVYSFRAFSHEKPVVRSLMENPVLYPPWDAKWKIGLLRYAF